MALREKTAARVRVVTGGNDDYVGAQGMKISPRISADTGAERLCAFYVCLEAGAETAMHHHCAEETVVLVLEGSNELWFGDRLEETVEVNTGDLVFIPAGCPHKVLAGPDGVTALEIRSGAMENTVVVE
ncbi:cupin domain-containing protein [Streptomyces sp. WAC06614]|uniref:cupin domain-containing protein n=1 Tax=Streptomyces sp. WAC06614 TaxID=2487416 RepID=UPI000F7B8918|nr:cupin domain-containing protein [Streptomyces sp. WAC06614]RSS81162.1 cupin domain-containing protein [Streptomyces sp. WAC06614]